MRKVTVIGLVVILLFSAVLNGTIFAQDGGTDQTQTAWLGVRLSDTDEGVVIRRVSADSPAETGGLLVGDVIVSIDGEAVDSADAFAEIVQSHAAGDIIAVVVSRDGSEETYTIELGTIPTRSSKDDLFASGDLDPLVMAEMVLHVELDAIDNGYEVLAGRMRDEADLQVGDIITAVNDTAVEDVDWAALVSDAASSDSSTLTLTVQRDGEEVTVESATLFGHFRGQSDNDSNRPGGGRQPGGHSHQDESGSIESTGGSAHNSESSPA